MQMILSDAEVKEYLRLKAIFNADADLDRFEKRLDYFYNTQLLPIHAREDLEHYPTRPNMLAVDAEATIRKNTEALLNMVAELREELKANQSNNKE